MNYYDKFADYRVFNASVIDGSEKDKSLDLDEMWRRMCYFNNT